MHGIYRQSFLSHKLGVARTLLDRCDGVVMEEEDKKKEKETIKTALEGCGYPSWTVKEVEKRIEVTKAQEKTKKKKKKVEEKEKSRGMVVLPYVKGLSE